MLSIKNIVENSNPAHFICLFIAPPFTAWRLSEQEDSMYKVITLDLSYENCASIGSEIQDQCWVDSKKKLAAPHESQWIQKTGVLIRAPVNQFTTQHNNSNNSKKNNNNMVTNPSSKSEQNANEYRYIYVYVKHNMIYNRHTSQKKKIK